MLILEGRPLSYDRAFTHAGIQYPANWLRLSSFEEKTAIGITEVPNAPWYDQRFYWGPDLPKDHEGLVTLWIDNTNLFVVYIKLSFSLNVVHFTSFNIFSNSIHPEIST